MISIKLPPPPKTENRLLDTWLQSIYRLLGTGIDTTNVQSAIDKLDSSKVNKSGDTMSGKLTAPGFISTASDNEQPYACSSRALNKNLNAEFISGKKLGSLAPALGPDDNYVTDTEKANLHAPHSDDQDLSGLVPTSRTVNSKALTTNITLSASDVGAPSGSGTSSGSNTGDQDLSGLVPTSRTVNSKALTTNITLSASDVGAPSGSGTSSGSNTGDQTLVGLGGVPTSRTVNSHPLSSDVTVSKSDVGLGNCDNTSDANKPVSTAQQTALDLKQNITYCGTAGGTADAITLTPSPAIASYANAVGQKFIFKSSGANTVSPPTVNISGKGALNTTMGSVAVPVGGIISGDWYYAFLETASSIRISPFDALSSHGDTLTGDLNFNKFKAIAMACDNGTSFPSSPATGQWYYRTDVKTLFIYEAAWKAIVSFASMNYYVDAGTGLQTVTVNNGGSGYAVGDKLIVANSQFITPFDSVQYYDGATYTNNTSEASSAGGTPFTILNTTADFFYAGEGTAFKFSQLTIDIATPGVGITLAAEYWTGSVWSALIIDYDNTLNLTQSGTIIFRIPFTWPTTTVNSVASKYWVRLKTTTNSSTPPTAYFAGIYTSHVGSVTVATISGSAVATVSINAVGYGHSISSANVTVPITGTGSGCTLDIGAVTPGGTDAIGQGYGSGASACKTIQYATNLIPALNGGTASVNIAPGVYREGVTIQGKYQTTSGSFNYYGTQAPITTSSVTSATQASVVSYSSLTWVCQVQNTNSAPTTSNPNWGLLANNPGGTTWDSGTTYNPASLVTGLNRRLNQDQYKILRLTGGTGNGGAYIILSNTAGPNTIYTIQGWNTTPDGTSTIAIEDWQTRVTGSDVGNNKLAVRSAIFIANSNTGVCLIDLELDYGTSYIVNSNSLGHAMYRLNIHHCQYMLTHNFPSTGYYYSCWMHNATSRSTYIAGGAVNFTDCVFSNTNGIEIFISDRGETTVQRCCILGGVTANGYGLQLDNFSLYVQYDGANQRNTFKNVTYAMYLSNSLSMAKNMISASFSNCMVNYYANTGQFSYGTGALAAYNFPLPTAINTTNSPSAAFDVHGSGTTTGKCFEAADSGGNARFTILDNGAATFFNKVTNYNNVATEGYGVPAIVDDVALTAQSASITTTNFTNGGTVGTYRLNYYLEATTLNVGATSVMLTIAFTDDAGATTVASTALPLTALGRTSGIAFIRLASGNVTYATTLIDATGLARYALYMSLERLS